MQVATKYIDSVAETLNLSGEEIIRESVRFYLEKKIRGRKKTGQARKHQQG